jgi:hypothetical protein
VFYPQQKTIKSKYHEYSIEPNGKHLTDNNV